MSIPEMRKPTRAGALGRLDRSSFAGPIDSMRRRFFQSRTAVFHMISRQIERRGS
jgi:hypothetical protein